MHIDFLRSSCHKKKTHRTLACAFVKKTQQSRWHGHDIIDINSESWYTCVIFQFAIRVSCPMIKWPVPFFMDIIHVRKVSRILSFIVLNYLNCCSCLINMRLKIFGASPVYSFGTNIGVSIFGIGKNHHCKHFFFYTYYQNMCDFGPYKSLIT